MLRILVSVALTVAAVVIVSPFTLILGVPFTLLVALDYRPPSSPLVDELRRDLRRRGLERPRRSR